MIYAISLLFKLHNEYIHVTRFFLIMNHIYTFRIYLFQVPEWQMMWGAKVKTPVDMPDDILKDSILFTTKELSGRENFENNGMFITQSHTSMQILCFSFCARYIHFPVFVFLFFTVHQSINQSIASINIHFWTYCTIYFIQIEQLFLFKYQIMNPLS